MRNGSTVGVRGAALAFVALVGSLALPAGCSGANAGCEHYMAAVCERLTTCQPGFAAVAFFNDADMCAERNSLLCPTLMNLPGLAATDDQLDACADDISSADCDAWIAGIQTQNCKTISSGGAPEPGGLPVIQGKNEDGDACAADFQCRSGLCANEGFFSLTCGTCGKVVQGGGPCDKDSSYCALGFYCGVDQSCHEAGSPGEPCLQGTCAQGLACLQGGCGVPLAEGDVCSSGDECNVFALDDCDPQSGVCAPLVSAYWGDKCDPSELTCHAGFYCDAFTDRCTPQVADGAACPGGNECWPPAQCVDGTCQIPSSPACSFK